MVRGSACLVALAGCVAGCAGGAAGAPPPSAPTPLLLRPLPDVRRVALDGTTIETARWRGHVVVVDFFAETCRPCARVLPSVEALHRGSPEIVVLGVSEDDDADGALRVVRRHELTFPVVHDEGHVLAGRFRVTEMPATFVVDPAGVVRWKGATEAGEDLEAAVRSVR